MALEIKEETQMAMWTADRRVYLNADRSKVVPEDSPEAAFLLVGEGGQIPEEDAKRYGLLKPARATQAGEAEEETESKARSAPPENKARSKASTEDK